MRRTCFEWRVARQGMTHGCALIVQFVEFSSLKLTLGSGWVSEIDRVNGIVIDFWEGWTGEHHMGSRTIIRRQTLIDGQGHRLGIYRGCCTYCLPTLPSCNCNPRWGYSAQRKLLAGCWLLAALGGKGGGKGCSPSMPCHICAIIALCLRCGRIGSAITQSPI